jgi:hypothetical protein
MKTYARIDATGVVAELLTTDADPAKMFHRALRWQDVTGLDVHVGWITQGTGFAAPAASDAPSTVSDLAALQAQIATLSAQIAVLQAKS